MNVTDPYHYLRKERDFLLNQSDWKMIKALEIGSDATALKDKNKLDLTIFSGGSIPSGVTATMDYGRLIFSIDNSSYTDYFELAHSTSVATPITRTKALGTESSSIGDGTVVFQEILCISENL